MNARTTVISILTLALTIVLTREVSAQILERVEVKDYELRWNDAGSGNKHDIALWHPKPPSGYFTFGSIGLDSNRKKPANEAITYAYKPRLKIRVGDKEMDAIVYPTDYKLAWKDKGSGAKKDGSIWEPIPPANYVALGCVAVSGYKKPSVNDSACILTASNLVEQVEIKQTRYTWYSNGVAKAGHNIFDMRTFRAGPDKVAIFTVPLRTSSHQMFVMSDVYAGIGTMVVQGKLTDIQASALKR